MRIRQNLSAGAASVLALLGISIATPARGQAFTEFPIPTLLAGSLAIASGPDGNLWFTESGFTANKIGRITPAGLITEFSIPTANSFPLGIVTGPDGNLWFTERNSNKIARITTAGVITEVITTAFNSNPQFITAGPDGNLWFTEYNGQKIGRITTAGVLTEFPVGPGRQPHGIAAGPDGNLWFTEFLGNQIGRITTSGTITEFPIPTSDSRPYDIATGTDGNLWFTEQMGNRIGRITTAGVITEYPLPTAASGPTGIAAGPDGALWFTQQYGNRIGRITTAGAITEFPIPTASSGSAGIAAGPDGNLWFTESSSAGNRIGRLVTGSVFFALAPCRLFDTRNAVGPDAAAPPLSALGTRTIAINGRCGLPATARILSVNMTITGAAASGTLLLYPADLGSAPLATSISFRAGQTRANNDLLLLAVDGTGFKVLNGSAGLVDFILDVNGWFE
jgi:streptogramin lyase